MRAGLQRTQGKMFVLMRQSGLKPSQLASQVSLKVLTLDLTFQSRLPFVIQALKTLKTIKLTKWQRSRQCLKILVLHRQLIHLGKDWKMLLRLAWSLWRERDNFPQMRYQQLTARVALERSKNYSNQSKPIQQKLVMMNLFQEKFKRLRRLQKGKNKRSLIR